MAGCVWWVGGWMCVLGDWPGVCGGWVAGCVWWVGGRVCVVGGWPGVCGG